MAQPNDAFEMAWSSLAEMGDVDGWRTIQIEAPEGCVLRAGRRNPGNEEAFLIGLDSAAIPANEPLPQGQGFQVERVDLGSEGKSWLALTRKAAGSIELFHAMVVDVSGALFEEDSSDEQRLLHAFLRRVRAWQEFMRKGAQMLSPEAEIGLIGELALLRALIEAGASPAFAVAAWVGPLGHWQDFEVGPGAFEVKSTLSAAGFPARVGALEQLDDSARQPIFIVGCRFRQLTSEGQNLPGFVRQTRELLCEDQEAQRVFSDLLFEAGYHKRHAELYLRLFQLAEMRVVEVGAGFPRLTIGTVPMGITRAQYEIDLDKAPGEPVALAAAMKELGAI
jgi:hypothetical protein